MGGVFGGNRDLSDLARTLTRVTSYVTDLGGMPADFAISRLKRSRGVTYLDGGFGSLVEGLSAVASAVGATIREHQPAAGITAVPGGLEVALVSADVLRAAAVVIAAGGPGVARQLLPVDPGWPELGAPVTAACLDLGLRGPSPSVAFGLDEPPSGWLSDAATPSGQRVGILAARASAGKPTYPSASCAPRRHPAAWTPSRASAPA